MFIWPGYIRTGNVTKKSQGNPICINGTGNGITLTHVASQSPISNKAAATPRNRKKHGAADALKTILSALFYNHKVDYDWGNLIPLTERNPPYLGRY